MKIILTGYTGNIGSTIYNTLLERNIEIIGLNSSNFDLSSQTVQVPDYQSVDGLIYCSGINSLLGTRDINFKEFEKLFLINTYGFIKLCSSLNFNQGANIIAIGSLYSQFVKELRGQYAMSKSALLSIVKTLALEIGNDIKVNMISPGFIDNELTRKNNSKQRIHELNEKTPLGLVSSKSIADLCLFLIENNKHITGQNLIIDAGYSLVGV